MTLISVIIPSRDRPAMLREAVESVLTQTYRPIEVIIVLTGATAAVKQTAEELADRHGIRLLETPARNLATTRNNGLAFATGEWVAFLDDDDLWLPTKLEKQLAKARETGADAVTTNWERFDESGRINLWSPSGASLAPDDLSFAEALMLENWASVGSLVRREALEHIGGFDPALRACEDWDCWRRLAHHHRFAYVGDVLMRVRVHSANMSKNRLLMLRTAVRHVVKMHMDTPRSLRHMLPKARRALAWQAACAIYETINDRTDNSARKLVRSLKRHPV